MRVLLIGCGRMGERYVDALEAIADGIDLTSVDPRIRLDASAVHYSSLDEVAPGSFDLAIDAATNTGRCERLTALLERGVPRVVVEKPHAQSLSESAAMVKLARSADCRVMIPFYRRFLSHYQPDSLADIGAGHLTGITVTAGAIGMGCNGVHFLDLANFLFGGMPQSIFAELQMDTITSPRGDEFSDFSGTIISNYNRGNAVLTVDHRSARGIVVDLSFEHGKALLHKQVAPTRHYYVRPEQDKAQPVTRTHMESLIKVPDTPLLDLHQMMCDGLTALINDREVPHLDDGHVVLNQIQTAFDSSRSGRKLPFEVRDRGDDQFSFT